MYELLIYMNRKRVHYFNTRPISGMCLVILARRSLASLYGATNATMVKKHQTMEEGGKVIDT